MTALGRPFKKGESGNPGGRPRQIADIQALAREHSVRAVNALTSIMEDEKASPAARVSAASAILDRAYGRPIATVHSSVLSRSTLELTDAELVLIAAGGGLGDDR